MQVWSEVRQWIQLLFVVIGGVLALVAYFQNLRQRRVENALKFMQLFRDGLQPDDMAHWQELFVATSEPCGAPIGQYMNTVAMAFRPISDWFSEGSEDGHAISRMAQSLDVVCHQVVSGAADARTVYYELGQLLTTMNSWLCSVPGNAIETSLSDSFPSIQQFFREYHKEIKSWPCRVYAYVE